MSVISNSPQTIVGESDVDFIYGSTHDDFYDLNSDEDDLKIVSFDGDDDIFSGLGDDILIGGAGNDFIFAHAGNNLLRGGSGEDYLLSKVKVGEDRGDYRDVMKGGSGDDVLASESSQNCTMSGGAGDDFFSFRNLGAAESGVSYCVGGSGADSFNFFEFQSIEDIDPTNTVVRIKDFDVGIDTLKFHFYGDEYQTNEGTSFVVAQQGNNMVIDFQDKVSIILHGIDSNNVVISELFESNDFGPIDPILF